MTIKNLWVKTICGLLFLLCHSAQAAISDASDALSSLLSGFQTLTAQFDQVIYDAKKQPIQTMTGRMALSRPGKFRWEIQAPNAQLLVANEHYLWIYDVDLSQATRQAMNKNKISSPASLLSGSVSDLKSRFVVTRLTENPIQSFQLTPKNTGDLFKQINISFKSGKLMRMTLVDNLGSLSVFQFSQVELNSPLDVAFFEFKAPKGVDVIQN
jgi:outer membrane lipoprotein carrier protein